MTALWITVFFSRFLADINNQMLEIFLRVLFFQWPDFTTDKNSFARESGSL
jgi:hypothetical protein